ncbi:MAG: dihydrolipoyl dehydrogenase [Spirochaetales bacterium]|uniref:Dihydrolipoyl dehydrogenase n=1 Tax=Candidatus Thalassospirochaeta sargassi TaxID=3119039 RepID=A0AAJ1ICP9_9SPIO|nr:dihydrolipoyl dehydrogenase [Spirochaetales bacterium]
MYDLIIVGAGPAGYIAAERAGHMGKKVLIVEREHLGGVCTNYGCIPTKSLLNAAKHFVYGQESSKFGVHFDNPRFNFTEAMAWKTETVETLRKGIAFLMKQGSVEVVKGEAGFPGGTSVSVDKTVYEGINLLIATGSEAFVPPIPGADGPNVVTNREILSLDKLPQKLAVIGGGVIGVEFASFFSSVGVEVHVIEMMNEICPMMDAEAAALLRKKMDKVDFQLGAKVTEVTPSGVKFEKTDEKSGEKAESFIDADMVLMSVGRRPITAGLENTGLDIGRQGIVVDEKMHTNLPGVWAAGDVTGKSLLAHSASRMAEVAVANMFAGDDASTGGSIMRYNAVPWAVYTMPEVAGCGLTEGEARDAGYNVNCASMQMRANGRFLAEHGKDAGFCKVIADADTNLILGIHMIGAVCSEMIGTAATFIEAELRVQDIREIIFPHPSVSEVIRDVCWSL